MTSWQHMVILKIKDSVKEKNNINSCLVKVISKKWKSAWIWCWTCNSYSTIPGIKNKLLIVKTRTDQHISKQNKSEVLLFTNHSVTFILTPVFFTKKKNKWRKWNSNLHSSKQPAEGDDGLCFLITNPTVRLQLTGHLTIKCWMTDCLISHPLISTAERSGVTEACFHSASVRGLDPSPTLSASVINPTNTNTPLWSLCTCCTFTNTCEKCSLVSFISDYR